MLRSVDLGSQVMRNTFSDSTTDHVGNFSQISNYWSLVVNWQGFICNIYNHFFYFHFSSADVSKNITQSIIFKTDFIKESRYTTFLRYLN